MIKISLDEAYVFDYVSILEIKIRNGVDVVNAMKQLSEELVEQLGSDTVLNILQSPEYKELYDANKATFDAVNHAKNDLVKASYVDNCNYKRMIAKKNLQKKFFDTPLTEKKIGYSNE